MIAGSVQSMGPRVDAFQLCRVGPMACLIGRIGNGRPALGFWVRWERASKHAFADDDGRATSRPSNALAGRESRCRDCGEMLSAGRRHRPVDGGGVADPSNRRGRTCTQPHHGSPDVTPPSGGASCGSVGELGITRGCATVRIGSVPSPGTRGQCYFLTAPGLGSAADAGFVDTPGVTPPNHSIAAAQYHGGCSATRSSSV